jgi:hypothetical protein
MSRRMRMVCAAALLFVAAGCSAGSFLLSWVGAGGKQQLVTGSIDQVAAHLKASLGKVDILVVINPIDDGTIKLNGQTKSGQRFALVLKRRMTSQGENTVLSIEWEKDADEQFWFTVLEMLVQQAPAGSAPASANGINSGR